MTTFKLQMSLSFEAYLFSYVLEPTSAGAIYRPKIEILLQSKSNDWYLFKAYVDSGSDISLFTRTDAEILGLSLYQGEYRPIVGIGKLLIPTYLHNITIKIGETTLNVRAAFADSDEVPRLLGRTGLFKRFKITFDEERLEIIFETKDS